jgi:hypothetical protein
MQFARGGLEEYLGQAGVLELLPISVCSSLPRSALVLAKAPPPPPATTAPRNCDPAYPDVCLHDGIGDYDCAGGTGNGPNYVHGPIRVLSPCPSRGQECCYHHPCRLAHRSKMAEMAAMTASTTARWGKSVRPLTMMFIP